MRRHSAIDYSRSIIDWLENSQEEATEKWDAIVSGALRKKQKELLGDLEASSLPKFKTRHMQKTCFSDLRFRLGNGYLYCHQVWLKPLCLTFFGDFTQLFHQIIPLLFTFFSFFFFFLPFLKY